MKLVLVIALLVLGGSSAKKAEPPSPQSPSPPPNKPQSPSPPPNKPRSPSPPPNKPQSPSPPPNKPRSPSPPPNKPQSPSPPPNKPQSPSPPPYEPQSPSPPPYEPQSPSPPPYEPQSPSPPGPSTAQPGMFGPKPARNICTLRPVRGPCKALLTRYYYNANTIKCETFKYSGCGGNDNRFKTLQACYKRCDICSLPYVTGPCRASMTLYYYNAQKMKCETFVYGGCRGNDNRFKTLDACNKRCDICTQPFETGVGRAAIPQYYYNTKTMKCEKFIYGGLGGNGNRFRTLDACKKRCGPKNRKRT